MSFLVLRQPPIRFSTVQYSKKYFLGSTKSCVIERTIVGKERDVKKLAGLRQSTLLNSTFLQNAITRKEVTAQRLVFEPRHRSYCLQLLLQLHCEVQGCRITIPQWFRLFPTANNFWFLEGRGKKGILICSAVLVVSQLANKKVCHVPHIICVVLKTMVLPDDLTSRPCACV